MTQNPSKIGQIAEKGNRNVTVLHVVLTFQVDCDCFQREIVSANFRGKEA